MRHGGIWGVVCAAGVLSGCIFSKDKDRDDGGDGDGDAQNVGTGGDVLPGSGGAEDGTGGTEVGNSGGETASGGGAGSGGSTPVDPTDPFAQARIDCVERINGFRATEGLPPLERWVDQEGCVDEQSEADASDGPHANFGMCDEWAQDTCPGWGSVEQVIQGCLQSMWDEGPGEPYEEHGHYINMSSMDFTKVACGFFLMQNGEIWHNHNFK